MGFAKPIEQIFIKLSRYIYVSKRYYTRRNNMDILITIAFLALYYILGLGTMVALISGVYEDAELVRYFMSISYR